jgi:hypothetical protein
MFFAASGASAIVTGTISNLTVTGAGASSIGNDVTASLGSTATVEFDITLSNSGGDIGALGLSVSGYDTGAVGTPTDDVIAYVSGSTTVALFATFNTGGPPGSANGMAFGGVTDLQVNPAEISIAGNPFQLNVFNVFNTTGGAGAGPGSNDNGVNGLVGGPQAHLIFQLTGLAGDGDLTFGLGIGDAVTTVTGVPVAVVGDQITVTVVPEPGTALLMGLGLFGLSAVGRRK